MVTSKSERALHVRLREVKRDRERERERERERGRKRERESPFSQEIVSGFVLRFSATTA